MKKLISLLFCVPFLFCMEPQIAIGQEFPKEKINSLKKLTSDQEIAAGTLVVIKNGIYKVAEFEKKCGSEFYQVIIKLDPRSGAIMKSENIFLIQESKE